MTNTEIEHKVISVRDLLAKENLKIPDYQRPYKWTTKNVNQLIDDIIEFRNTSEYRLGTVVIYRDKSSDQSNGDQNIIDGQQRVITLLLMVKALKKLKEEDQLIEEIKRFPNETELQEFLFTNDISMRNIYNNYQYIKTRVNEFDEDLQYFLLNQCTFVMIIHSDISEAFQFFDSQNSRGKDLAPHDLLKAYHLRDMATLSTKEKVKSVKEWEAIDNEELSILFDYLYKIKRWSRGTSAGHFSKDEIDLFKGISLDEINAYPFAKMYSIAHHYTDAYNNDYQRKIDENGCAYPFQIDQAPINGRRFFEMIAHYKRLVDGLTETEELIKRLEQNNDKNSKSIIETISNYEGQYRIGDMYVKQLFYCCLIYFIDKFGALQLSKAIEKSFIWAYTMRLTRVAVHFASIDKYASGDDSIFKSIRESINPIHMLNAMKLNCLDRNQSTMTDEIFQLFKEMGYYIEKQ